MRELDIVHYFVHLGYDENEQPDFERSVTERIELLKEKTKQGLVQAIVMVDEPMISREQADIYNLVGIADIIQEFLLKMHMIGVLGENGISENYIKNFFEINSKSKGIISELMKLLGQELLILAKNYEKYYPRESQQYQELTKIQDDLYIDLLEKEFLNILKKLWKKYRNENIGNLDYSEGLSLQIPVNYHRRSRIHKYIGEDSGLLIVQGYMRNGDSKRLNFGNSIEREFSVDVSEQEFGNALPVISRMSNGVNKRQILGLYFDIEKQLNQEGLIVTDSTYHIVGGEYLGRCVNAFAEMLLLISMVNPLKLIVDSKISLNNG